MGHVMSGRDSVVILPTGGGKSLCYQAPAVALPGMAVVVSPLLSLMKDQVDTLRTSGVAAARIDSTLTQREREQVHGDVISGLLKLLYVSPERLAQPRFVDYLREAGVSFFVIDEAHCISHWGHDFRPEYRALINLRTAFPGAAIHAYTATATEHVRTDIITQLGLREPAVVAGYYDRPNLTYRVQRRTNAFEQVRALIDTHPGESGIVYCIRRADVDAMCERLCAAGYKALPYHAGMDDRLRARNQDAFAREEADIVVATVAFGMGIDKSNVRYVIHAGMPKSIEHYHQETGRAGRDGLPADCWLLYSYQDFRVWQSILDKAEGDDEEPVQVARAKLSEMLRYCEQMTCRHKSLVSYFGQEYADVPCGACDVCLNDIDCVDNADGLAQTILACITAIGGMAGPTYTSLVLTGSTEERVRSKGHHALPTYGALAAHPPRVVREWLEQLVQQGLLVKTGEYSVLVPTPKGMALMQGEGTAQLARPAEQRPRARKAAPPAGLTEADAELFEALRLVRRRKAAELNVAPFVIFADAALRDMARMKPCDTRAFLACHGVGQRKCELFGHDFLSAIREFVEQKGLAPAPMPAAPERNTEAVAPASRRVSRREETKAMLKILFDEKRPIEEVCEMIQRKPLTVLEYLEEYLTESGATDPSPWVEPAVYEQVCQAVASVAEKGRLKPIFEHLHGEVPYETIRLCMACKKNMGL